MPDSPRRREPLRARTEEPAEVPDAPSEPADWAAPADEVVTDSGWWKGDDGIWYPPAGVQVPDTPRRPRR